MNTEAGKLLQNRFAGDDGCVLFEVPDATGLNKTRSADAISMNFWPSRGLLIEGYEYKCQRGDWLKELKTPEKADGFFSKCDMWWLITSDDKIAKVDEIPAGWGWIAVKAKKLHVKVKATRREKPIYDRNFIAGLLRAATKVQKRENRKDHQEQDRLFNEAFNKGVETGKKANEGEAARLQAESNGLANIIADFEKSSGLRLVDTSSWWRSGVPARAAGEAVRKLTTGHSLLDLNLIEQMRKQLNDIEMVAKQFREAEQALMVKK
ncbi:MAG: hypothetical protein ACO1RA_02395 [Planctomycetaceae bacterium]